MDVHGCAWVCMDIKVHRGQGAGGQGGYVQEDLGVIGRDGYIALDLVYRSSV